MTALKVVSDNTLEKDPPNDPKHDLTAAVKSAITVLPPKEGGKAVLNTAELEPALRKKVDHWYSELRVDMVAFGRAGLKIGRVLAEARSTLKPLGVWGAFLNRVPGMSGRTAERFVARYEMARKSLPESVLALATTTGVDLAGATAQKPFGRYSEAVKRVGPPPRDTGDAAHDSDRARVWLGRVLVVQAKERAGARKKGERDPTAKVSDQLAAAVRRYTEKESEQVPFLRAVMGRTLRTLGWGRLIVMQSRDRAKKAA